MATKTQSRRFKVGRDSVIAGVAIALLVYEIVLGGNNPAALTAITSILLSPVILRVDEARRNNKNGNGGSS